MIDPTPLPGLAGRTIVVLGASSQNGVAVSRTLVASGAAVLAADDDVALPTPLVDAGTGLPGVLHYRHLDASRDTSWSSLGDWIGEHAAGVHGFADLTGHDGIAALMPHLLSDASIVRLSGAPDIAGVRSSVVAPHPDADPLDVAASIAFLLSESADAVDRAVIPVHAASSR